MTALRTQEPAQVPPTASARGSGGFVHLLRAEWTKLWSVPRWLLALAAVAAITVGYSALTAAGSSSSLYEEPSDIVAAPDGLTPVMDQFRFVHQPLTGDGSVSARVHAQDDSHPEAMAGVMIKERAAEGVPYAALFVTPQHGVRLESNFTTEVAGGGAGAPRWLRLTRAGSTVTGEASADGSSWQRVGSVELPMLSATVPAGLFVTSPYARTIERTDPFVEIGSSQSTIGTATFDGVRVAPAAQARPLARWSSTAVGDPPDPGDTSVVSGSITVSGSGGIEVSPDGHDIVPMSLAGALPGMLAAALLGVSYVTAEYAHGTILATFTAAPRRVRVLGAKAIVIGVTTLGAGLIGSATAFVVSQPLARASGFALPGAPPLMLTDGPVLRAVVGSALLIALAALLGLGVGTLLRRRGVAGTVVVALLLVPSIVANSAPSAAAGWVRRLTPQLDLAIQRSYLPPGEVLGAWTGVVALAAWAAIALALAAWLLRRRDA